MDNIETINAKLNLNNAYEHKVLGNVTRIDQVTKDYNTKLKEIKNIIKENAAMIYPKCWVINETNEEKQELLIHYFNLLKQDLYIIYFTSEGLQVKTNETNYHNTYPKIPVLIKEYLSLMHEKFVTHSDFIKKVHVAGKVVITDKTIITRNGS